MEWHEQIEANLKLIEKRIADVREQMAKVVHGDTDAEGCVVYEGLLEIETLAVKTSNIYARNE